MARRARAILLLFGALSVAFISFGLTGAGAHQADIEARGDCRGIVTFTTTSWSTGPEGANTRIGVYFAVGDGPFRPVAPDAGTRIVSSNGVAYEFTAANGNRFTDKFVVPAHTDATKVTVKAKALAKWGNGNEDAAEKVTVVDVPAPCSAPTTRDKPAPAQKPAPTTSTTAPARQRAPTTAVTTAPTSTSTSAPAAPAASAANPNVPANRNAPASAAQTTGASAVIENVCNASAAGWSVRIKNEGSQPQPFEVRAGGRTVGTVTVPAGSEQTRTFEFSATGVAQGSDVVVTVRSAGATIAERRLTANCLAASAGVMTRCETPAGSGAVLTFSNTGPVFETFNVTRDGRPVAGSPVLVGPDLPSEQKLLRLNEDESANLLITGTRSGVRVQQTVTLDCVEVLSAQVVRTANGLEGVAAAALTQETAASSGGLAATGAAIAGMAAAGASLLVVGAGLLRISRRADRNG